VHWPNIPTAWKLTARGRYSHPRYDLDHPGKCSGGTQSPASKNGIAFPLLNYLYAMQQPELNREGYAIFVRCWDLSAATSTSKFVATIETLDDILFDQIDKNDWDFFPNPYGGAIFRTHVDEALAAACALVRGLGASGISAAIGMSWGRFQRTTNVHDWNAAARPLNEAPASRKLLRTRVRCEREGKTFDNFRVFGLPKALGFDIQTLAAESNTDGCG
jgi:hypothetical protein